MSNELPKEFVDMMVEEINKRDLRMLTVTGASYVRGLSEHYSCVMRAGDTPMFSLEYTGVGDWRFFLLFEGLCGIELKSDLFSSEYNTYVDKFVKEQIEKVKHDYAGLMN